jgi:hypothetical protein
MENGKKLLENILATVLKVITNPVGFYREMPKKGGFVEPIIFLVAMMLVLAVVNIIVAILHIGSYSMGLGMGVGITSAIFGLILGPIFGVIGSFIGAAIIFVIWKIMGSQEDFEAAYRCGAYACGIIPITAILSLIPYIGFLILLVWGSYLLIVASIEVHKIKPQTAWLVWGIIAGALIVFLIVFSLLASFVAKRAFSVNERQIEKTSKEMEKAAKEMEEAFKKMQEEMQKQQQK